MGNKKWYKILMAKRVFVLLVLCLIFVTDAMGGVLITYPKFQAIDSTGAPLSGGKLTTYASGTTTAKPTYTTKACNVANANPVILDTRGEATIYGTGLYKLVLTTSLDVAVWTMDGVEFAGGSGAATYYADPTETDQGIAGNGGSLYDLLTAIGTSKKATVILSHNGIGNTTTYTLTTTYDASAYANVTLKFEPGAILACAGDFTFAGPLDAGPTQIFSGAGAVTFGARVADRYLWQWFGAGTVASGYLDISTPLQALADSLPTVAAADDSEDGPGTVFLSEGRYRVNGVTFPQGVKIVGASAWSTMLFWSASDFSIRIKKITLGNQPISTIEGINFRGGGDSTTNKTSGTLTSGELYQIVTFVAGDDFSNIGGQNASNTWFVASGTTPTTWTNGSTVSRRLGNVYSGQYAGDAKYSTETHIRDCWFGPSYVGINIYGSTDHFIHGNVYDGGQTAIVMFNTLENKIYNNEFYAQTRTSIHITENNKTLDRVNYIYDNRAIAMLSGFVKALDSSSTGAKGTLIVRDNDLTFSASGAIYSTDPVIYTNYMDEVYITGNYIKSENATKSINGIYANNVGTALDIRNNRIEGVSYGMILTNGPGERHNEVAIIGNTTKNTTLQGIRLVTGFDGAVIKDNQVYNANLAGNTANATGCGIYIESNDVRLTRNKIGDMKITPLMYITIYYATAIYGIVEEDNLHFGWVSGITPTAVTGTAEVVVLPKRYAATTSAGVKAVFAVGDTITQSDVSSGNPTEWVCTGAGSQSSIGTLSGGIVSGGFVLTLAAAPSTLKPGALIDIAGVTGPQRVKWIDGLTAYVTPAADATVVAANVTDTAPTFVSAANAP